MSGLMPATVTTKRRYVVLTVMQYIVATIFAFAAGFWLAFLIWGI